MNPFRKKPRINADKRRFVHLVSAFICVHLRFVFLKIMLKKAAAGAQ
jgi:hypothetical protein